MKYFLVLKIQALASWIVIDAPLKITALAFEFLSFVLLFFYCTLLSWKKCDGLRGGSVMG
jgi:hypothetical protein